MKTDFVSQEHCRSSGFASIVMLMLLTVLMGFAAVYVVDKPNRRALAEYEAKWEQGCHAAGGKIQ